MLLALLCLMTAWAGIDYPMIGQLMDERGFSRTVYGIAGSFLIGDPEARTRPTSPPDFPNVTGEILSWRAVVESYEVAVRRKDGVWIVTPTDEVVDWIGETTGPVLLLEGGVLFASGDQLVLRRPDASELKFSIAFVGRIST